MSKYKPDAESVSVLDHVKDMVVQLMIAESDSINPPIKKSTDKDFIVSSESESETSRTNQLRGYARVKLFEDVIDDYLGKRKGPIHKTIRKVLDGKEEETTMEDYARLFLEFDLEYTKRIKESTSGKKTNEYIARAAFAKVGHMTLRNGNSSSILERSFGDVMRSVADRRVALRKIFI